MLFKCRFKNFLRNYLSLSSAACDASFNLDPAEFKRSSVFSKSSSNNCTRRCRADTSISAFFFKLIYNF